MIGDDLVARARAEAAKRTVVRADEASLEAVRSEAAELFDLVPEPPVYRRADDPTRARAVELGQRGVELLARVLAARQAAPDDARLSTLAEAVETHLRVLAAMATGDIGAGETLAREARDLARGSTQFASVWRLATAPPPARVYNAATGESRYDPRPEPLVSVQLVCPKACRKVAAYAISPRSATHSLTCANCHGSFTAYFAEARSVETTPVGSALHYALRVDELGGVERRVEFDDASGADLAVAPRDMVVFLHGPQQTLLAVMNLSTGRVLFVTAAGACFVAGAVYGPEAPQTRALRAFRDRRLLSSSAGRIAVGWYYRLSPPLANWAGRSVRVRRAARAVLDVVVRSVSP